MDRAGQIVGNYRLVRLLGSGGFADVYLAEHVYLGTPAAIKLLHAHLAPNDVDPFLQEARTLARLQHPAIVRVLDFGVERGEPYLVMDYAANGTLHQRHPKGTRLPLATILPYVQQVASALQFAHDHKLIHRDVKPENMLVGERDQVVLSDFGIAIVAQSSRYPRTQDVAGTLAYMAPEQIQSHPQPASDQYSPGIVIYEWLVGERPFTGTMQEVISKHLSVSPPPLRNALPHLAPGVEQVVLKALEKAPKERFASIQAFAAAFEQACQSDPSFISPSHQRLAPSLPLLFTEPPRQPSSPEGRLFSPASGTAPLSQPAAVNPLPDTIPVGPSGRPSASAQHDIFLLASPHPGTIPSPAGLLTPPVPPQKAEERT